MKQNLVVSLAALAVTGLVGCGASNEASHPPNTPETTSAPVSTSTDTSTMGQSPSGSYAQNANGQAGSQQSGMNDPGTATAQSTPQSSGAYGQAAGTSSTSAGSMTGGGQMDTGSATQGSSTWNDAQIAEIVNEANTDEIQASRFAAAHATNARVKHFAQHMLSAHGDASTKLTATLHKASITPVASSVSTQLNTDARQQLDGLKSKTGADFDRGYMDAMVQAHQTLLDTLDGKLIPQTQNADLKTTLTKLRGTVAEHLKDAKDIQQSLSSSK